MHSGNEWPHKGSQRASLGRGWACLWVTVLSQPKWAPLEAPPPGDRLLSRAFPVEYIHTRAQGCTRKQKTDTQPQGSEGQRGRGGSSWRWSSQTLNGLMSWGLINSGSYDCSRRSPEGILLRDSPEFPGDTQGALGHGLGSRDHTPGTRCLEHGTSVNLSR